MALDYITILDLSSDLLAHHFHLNQPFREAVRDQEIARSAQLGLGLGLGRQVCPPPCPPWNKPSPGTADSPWL